MVLSETKCSIYGFPIDAEEGDGWFDFVVKCEHLFLRNIYTFNELEQMDIETEEKYCEIINRLLELYPLFEKALHDSNVSDEVRSFLAEELMIVTQHSLNLGKILTKKEIFDQKDIIF